MNELEEFFSGLQLVPKDSQHGTGDRHRILFFHPSHHHAQMAGLHDDGDAVRLELGLKGFGNLDSQPSCTCRRRLKASTNRGILLSPTTFLFGM